MSKVHAFAVDGIQLWFNSNDHRPPHFHAETADGEVRVLFMRDPVELEVVWGQVPKKRIRRALEKLCAEHRDALCVEWSAKVACVDPGPEK